MPSIMVTKQPAIGRNKGGKKPEVTANISALEDLENVIATIPERQFGEIALGSSERGDRWSLKCVTH